MVKTSISVQLDEKRKGEIAWAVLKHIIKRQGVTLSQGFIRELGDVAKNINVPLAELKSFTQLVLGEVSSELFKHDVH